MDNLHMELMDALKKEHEKVVDADKYYKWWQEECVKTMQLTEQRKQDSENIIKLAKYVDDKDAEIATLEARIAELEKLNNPPYPATFSADLDMCEPVCDIPMKA